MSKIQNLNEPWDGVHNGDEIEAFLKEQLRQASEKPNGIKLNGEIVGQDGSGFVPLNIPKGDKGDRGNGIASIEVTKSTEDGGVNIVNITDDDGNETILNIQNGHTGKQGDSAVYNPASPDTPDFVMANELGDSTTKAVTQKTITDEINVISKLVTNNIFVKWTNGKFMHLNTPNSLRDSSVARISAPIPVEIGDKIVLGTYELPSNTFTAIAYLETEDASTWTKKIGISTFGTSDYHTVKWTANAAGYVVVSGMSEGMTLQIIPTNTVAKQSDVSVISNDVSEIQTRIKGTFNNWTWHIGSLHAGNGAVVSTNTQYRYSDLVTMNKGDKLVVRTFYPMTGTYTIIGTATGRIATTTSKDIKGTYLTKIYTATADSIDVRVCVYIGNGTEEYPIEDDYSAIITRADALVTKAELESVLDKDSTLPDYWKPAIADKLDNVQVEMGGDSFIFITDTHYSENVGRSADVIGEVTKNYPFSKVFHGGDICSTGFVKTYDKVPQNYEHLLIREIKAFDRTAEKASQYARFYAARGNHDFYEYSGVSKIRQTTKETVKHMFEKIETLGVKDNYATDPDGLYYYFDQREARIRYIVIDCVHGSDGGYLQPGVIQLEWLIETINATPQGYSIIALGHAPMTPYIATSAETHADNLEDVRTLFIAANNKASGNFSYRRMIARDADNNPIYEPPAGEDKADIRYDFTNCKAQVIAYICGHNHTDNQAYQNGIAFIMTVCDKVNEKDISPFNENNRYLKTKGTATEQALDCFIINAEKTIISTIRIGSGYDRHFNLGKISLPVGQSITLSPNKITAVSFGGTDEDIVYNNGWPYKHDFATIDPSTGVVTGIANGEVLVFAEDENHNKEFWAVTVE